MSKEKNGLTNDMGQDYEVGFCKPPKQSQFKKGQSGNPNGRPKGSLNLTTIFRRVGSEKIVINENGRHKSVSKGEAAVKQLMNGAAKGQLGHIRIALSYMSAVEAAEATGSGKSTVDLTDPSLLANLIEQMERSSHVVIPPSVSTESTSDEGDSAESNS